MAPVEGSKGEEWLVAETELTVMPSQNCRPSAGRRFLLGFVVLCLAAPLSAEPEQTVVQVSTIQALLSGLYDGPTTFAELRKYGDFALGTVNQLDGEMMGLDGVFYQVTSDNLVHRLSDDQMTPFAVVTRFRSQQWLPLRQLGLAQLESRVDQEILSKNYLYALRLEGKFSYLKLRSVPRQDKPYRSLAEVVKEQTVFEYREIEGTLIGFRFPAYLDGVGVPGYHLHFLSKDRTRGGHVLDLQLQEGRLALNECREFSLLLPDNSEFREAELESDRSHEIKKVEGR